MARRPKVTKEVVKENVKGIDLELTKTYHDGVCVKVESKILRAPAPKASPAPKAAKKSAS